MRSISTRLSSALFIGFVGLLLAAHFVLPLAVAEAPQAAAPPDPLPSWNQSQSKQAIITFINRTTTEGSPDFVPPGERIAVFDNDGTLWAEQPAYFQLIFAIDRVKALAPQHPEWQQQEPFKSVLGGDLKALAAQGQSGIAQIIAATHSGMTTDEFNAIASQWLATARHPTTNMPYTQMIYQPQLELLAYLRENGFTTYIVSGGGVEFMRAFAEQAYGILPEQVVGSRVKYKFETRDGKPVLVRLPSIDHLDDGPGKPVGIQQQIGRRPIIAVGNSDGDLQMLQWTTAGDGPALAIIVHHTDADREYAYDRESHIGKLDKALDEATQRGWTVVDMKDDWSTIYPNN